MCMQLPIGVVNELLMGQEGQDAGVAGGWHWADQLGPMDQTPTRETGLMSNMV